MAKPAGYASHGIRAVRLLDHDDFVALQFDGFDEESAGLYNNLVTAILREGEFIDLETAQTAKYNLLYEGNQYSHTIETFLGSMRHKTLAALDLATKRRKFVVLFQTNDGHYFLFGSDTGAKLTYTSQTDDASGSAIKISATSELPLFEVGSEAATQRVFCTAIRYIANPEGAYCLLENGKATGLQQYCYMMKVSGKSGEPLDIDGCLCSVSGKPQAYRKLFGANNLSGNFFSEGTFSEKDVISGIATYAFNFSSCAVALGNSIQIVPNQITANTNNTEQVVLSSKSKWTSSISNPTIARLSITNGSAGNYTIAITGIAEGACAITFTNIQTGEKAVLNVVCVPETWILQTGIWNDKGRWIDSANWTN